MPSKTINKKIEKYRGMKNRNINEMVKKSFLEPVQNFKTFDQKNQINTYDLIGYGTYMGFGGKIITKMVKNQVGEVCHIGLAVRSADFPETCKYYKKPDENNPRGHLYVFESTISGPYGDTNFDFDLLKCEPKCCHIFCGCPSKGPTCFSCDSGKGFMGVMVRNLDETINVYKNYEYGDAVRFFWCPLKVWKNEIESGHKLKSDTESFFEM